jgi:deazaflavin-dependent oxidoreductase (nitroreductase family)
MTSNSTDEASGLGAEQYCYLTTVGRVSGREHTIEIWFALSGTTLLMMSGSRDRAHWVRNVMQHPRVSIRLGNRLFQADGRIVEAAEEDALARQLLQDKYAGTDAAWFPDWVRTALPVAFDLI